MIRDSLLPLNGALCASSVTGRKHVFCQIQGGRDTFILTLNHECSSKVTEEENLAVSPLVKSEQCTQ